MITGQEQETLINCFFTAIVIEVGALMAKTITEVVLEKINYRKQKEEQIINEEIIEEEIMEDEEIC